jgi:hypothetical protein
MFATTSLGIISNWMLDPGVDVAFFDPFFDCDLADIDSKTSLCLSCPQ